MKLLLDTCVFLWLIKGTPELSEKAKLLFSSPDNEVFLSSISLWEILVKHQLGRLPLPNPPAQFIIEQRELHQIKSLDLSENAILYLSKLPDHHKDPFDRMLICQAIANNLTILTPDTDIQQYPIQYIW